MEVGTAILTNDKNIFYEQINISKKADFIQLDVIDGKFAPARTLWIDDLKEGIKKAKKPVELHLMVQEIDELIDDFLLLDAQTYIFHYETTQKHSEIIQKIKAKKKKVGIALKLTTSATVLRKLLEDLDLVLIYCTESIGEQGPSFNIAAIRNIAIVREYNKKISVEVDGGIKPHTARLCRLAGATRCVSGSYLFNNQLSDSAIKKLRDA